MAAASCTSDLLITVPPETVWALVCDPAHHHLFDATGMVVGLSSDTPKAVGDVFTMDMVWRSGDNVEHYQSDNLVTTFVPFRTIPWATALPGQQPLGWTWTYNLITEGPNTRVRLTYENAVILDGDSKTVGIYLDGGPLGRTRGQQWGSVN